MTLPNLLIRSSTFLNRFCKIFYLWDYNLHIKTILLLPFKLYALNFFQLPITLVRTAGKMLNRNGQNRHPWLIQSWGKAFNLSPLNMMLAIDFFIIVLCLIEAVLSFF